MQNIEQSKSIAWLRVFLLPHPSLRLSSPCSDFGFKLSDDLSLEVCVPDPEFAGRPYDPPVPCPVGSTYRKTRGYVLYSGGEPGPSNAGICVIGDKKKPPPPAKTTR